MNKYIIIHAPRYDKNKQEWAQPDLLLPVLYDSIDEAKQVIYKDMDEWGLYIDIETNDTIQSSDSFSMDIQTYWIKELI